MRVLYIHQHFISPKGSGSTRSYEMARYLIKRGHTVTMVCGAAEGDDLPLRKVRRNLRRGEIDGIDVVQLVLPYSNYDSFLRRSVVFIRFSMFSIRLTLTEHYNMLFATSTPLTVALSGIVMKLFRKMPFVFEIRDLWPEIPREMGIIRHPLILGPLNLLERLAYRSADGCVGLSPGMVEGIRRQARRETPIKLIPNGCDLDRFHPLKRSESGFPGVDIGDLVAVYAGAHGKANGLNAILDAAVRLKTLGRKDIKLAFIGDGSEKAGLKARAARENLDLCLFLDPIPKESLGNVMASADVGLMIFADFPALYRGTSPNKFFDYIASGLPVINNYPGWLADLITEHNCGIVVPPGDGRSLAEALVRLADNKRLARAMGQRARRLGEQKFDRRNLAGAFVEFLEGVAEAGPGSS